MTHENAMRSAYRDALLGTWIGIAVNLALGLAKIIAGLLGRSFALVSDGVHSFSDLVTSIGTVAGFRIAMKPPDENHPYGHSRAEAVIGAYLSLALVAAGIWVGIRAVAGLHESAPAPAGYVLWVAAASMVVKECLYQYKIRLGRRLESTSLIADAWDHRSDVLSSGAVLVGTALVRYAGWDWADDVATLIVAVTLLWAGVALLRDSTNELMDAQQNPAMLAILRATAMEVEGVRGVETLWIRKAGLEFLVDIHIEVDPDMSVRDSHGIAHDVQHRLGRVMPRIHGVLVHVEPHAPHA